MLAGLKPKSHLFLFCSDMGCNWVTATALKYICAGFFKVENTKAFLTVSGRV